MLSLRLLRSGGISRPCRHISGLRLCSPCSGGDINNQTDKNWINVSICCACARWKARSERAFSEEDAPGRLPRPQTWDSGDGVRRGTVPHTNVHLGSRNKETCVMEPSRNAGNGCEREEPQQEPDGSWRQSLIFNYPPPPPPLLCVLIFKVLLIGLSCMTLKGLEATTKPISSRWVSSSSAETHRFHWRRTGTKE